MKTTLLALCFSLMAFGPSVKADEGYPLALTHKGGGHVIIENFWMLSVEIDRADDGFAPRNPGFRTRPNVLQPGLARVQVRTSERFGGFAPNIERAGVIDTSIDRPPNSPLPVIQPAGRGLRSSNAIIVRSVATARAGDGGDDGEDDGVGLEGKHRVVVVEVDGVRVCHLGRLNGALTQGQLDEIGVVDVLLVPVGGVGTIDAREAVTVTGTIAPRLVIPFVAAGRGEIAGAAISEFLAALPENYVRRNPGHDTIAVCAGRGPVRETPWAVTISTAVRLPTDLEGEIKRKEKAGNAARSIFLGMSTAQMNHRPSNGTHTPRWNVEHMAGRELGFFSAIYSAIDPSIPRLDLNPAQMPNDYEAAHPDWLGVEEVRHIDRVQAFTRRFAYLTRDVDLDSLPRGCPKFVRNLRGLYRQMERHWGEHSAHVIEKMDLPDWPADDL